MPRVTGFMAKDSIDGALFWIDALCINQADRMEKEKQISRMGSIYNMAPGVIIWLGTTEDPIADKQIGDDFRFGRALMYIIREWYPQKRMHQNGSGPPVPASRHQADSVSPPNRKSHWTGPR